MVKYRELTLLVQKEIVNIKEKNMKKKFDYCTINVHKNKTIPIDSEHCECSLTLSGNTELGLEINQWTWRADWLAEVTFKDPEERAKWDLKAVYNNIYYQNGIEYNDVKGVWRKRHSFSYKN